MIGGRSRISVAVGVVFVMVFSAAAGVVRAPGIPPTVVANAGSGLTEWTAVLPEAPVHFDSMGSSPGTVLTCGGSEGVFNTIMNSNTFNPVSRGGIFHNTLFGHRGQAIVNRDDGSTECTGSWVGVAEQPGIRVMMAEEQIGGLGGTHEWHEAWIFMQELGHNLGLPHTAFRHSAMNHDSPWVEYNTSEWNVAMVSGAIGGA